MKSTTKCNEILTFLSILLHKCGCVHAPAGLKSELVRLHVDTHRQSKSFVLTYIPRFFTTTSDNRWPPRHDHPPG